MPEPVNGLLAARMDPERRRRIGNALLAAQFDRETPQDAAVIERAGLFPLGTYANGQTGPAWPGIIATPVEKMAQVLRGEITPGTPEFNEAGFDIAGAAMVGGLAAARPRGSLGMSGRPTEPHPWASLDPPPKPSPFPHGVKREWSPGGETVEIYTAETKPYPMGGHGRMPGSFSDEPLAAGKLELKPRSDGSGEWVWPFTEAEEALVRSYGARGAPDLYANARPGAALGAGLSGASERQGIRAYHGSPHDFDKFDMSKIGTGEGAQAYGHGLYFAENEGVAKGYRDGLSPTRPPWGLAKEGRYFPADDASYWGVQRLNEKLAGQLPYGSNDVLPHNAITKALAEVKADAAAIKGPNGDKLRRELASVEAVVNSNPDLTFMRQPPTGRMYEVNIKASPDDFLDWDKPLSQQPKVSELVGRDEQGRLMLPNGERAAPDKLRGESFYRAFAEAHGGGTQPGSQALRDAGIPGIKYLDQGSRSAGEGSRNYVVFDANLIEILRKYGLLGMLGAGGMAQELLKPSKPNIPDDAA